MTERIFYLRHKEPTECKLVPKDSLEGYVEVTLDNTLFPHEWFFDYIDRVGLRCEGCGNALSPIEAGDSLEIAEKRYRFTDKSIDQFNTWMHVGMPVPSVYVPMQAEDGTDESIHVTKITESLGYLTSSTREE